MVFSGPYPSPTVVVVPGLIPAPASENYRINWGEDIVLTVPDPGVDCTMTLVIKDRIEDDPIIVQSYERTSNAGDITFRIHGTTAKDKLVPGIYYAQVVQVRDTGTPPLRYSALVQMTFELVDSAVSSVVAGETDSPGVTSPLPSYPMVEFFLAGEATVGQIFGFFRLPSVDLVLKKVTVLSQTPPTGAGIGIDVIDPDGGAFVTGLVLPDGDSYAEVEFNAVTISAQSAVRARIAQVGSTVPGENVTVQFHFDFA